MKLIATCLTAAVAFAPLQGQGLRARATLDSRDVVEGKIQFQDAVWISGDGTHRLQAPSNRVRFLAQGSSQMVDVSLDDIDSLTIRYTLPKDRLTVDRAVNLILTDGTSVDGTLPSAPNGGLGSGTKFTNGVLIETARLVVSEFQLPSFASSSIPMPPPNERVAAIKIIRGAAPRQTSQGRNPLRKPTVTGKEVVTEPSNPIQEISSVPASAAPVRASANGDPHALLALLSLDIGELQRQGFDPRKPAIDRCAPAPGDPSTMNCTGQSSTASEQVCRATALAAIVGMSDASKKHGGDGVYALTCANYQLRVRYASGGSVSVSETERATGRSVFQNDFTY